MYALLQILLSLCIMIFLLRKHIHISYAVLAATVILFSLSGFSPRHLAQALYTTTVSWTTWNMVLTLYLVICLEYLLRTSGILKNFTQAAGNLFGNNRVVLAFMPAFLGFLPSLGGAIFSAPMVEEAAHDYCLSPAALVYLTAFFMGLRTSLPQGFAAIAFLLIVPMLGTDNLDALALTYVCGLTGVMLSPAHLCLIVTIEYFQASLFSSLKPVALAQLLLLGFTFLGMIIF